MKFTRMEIPDVILCEPTIHGDERGYFVETFREDKLNDFLGYKVDFCQDNESKSSQGVLRGLHYQLPPYAQSKLVRVIKGTVLDVAVDIRRGSPTFGQYVSHILSEDDKKQFFVPRGFAHGFVVLSESAIFAYKCDNYYAPEYDRGILFDDSNIDIDWIIDHAKLQLSDKDKNQPLLKDTTDLFEYGVDYYAN
jgi:dTDP-4-dehydrorhamnose 3,5-epimerase